MRTQTRRSTLRCVEFLRKQDPKWHAASVKWMRTIDAPEDYDEQLPGLGEAAP